MKPDDKCVKLNKIVHRGIGSALVTLCGKMEGINW